MKGKSETPNKPLSCMLRMHWWSRVMRIGGPQIRMCRRCYVVKVVGE